MKMVNKINKPFPSGFPISKSSSFHLLMKQHNFSGMTNVTYFAAAFSVGWTVTGLEATAACFGSLLDNNGWWCVSGFFTCDTVVFTGNNGLGISRCFTFSYVLILALMDVTVMWALTCFEYVVVAWWLRWFSLLRVIPWTLWITIFTSLLTRMASFLVTWLVKTLRELVISFPLLSMIQVNFNCGAELILNSHFVSIG